ncbi:MAG: TlpA disulfide reductase family protein [Burkholderiaceae bacterium]
MEPVRHCRTSRREMLAAVLAASAALMGPRAAQAADAVQPWPAHKPAPPLELQGLEGKHWSLDRLRGQVLLLNFWATWCPPCRDEMPSLELLATRYENAGFGVLAVNYREPPETIRRFLEVLPFSLPILLDRDGRAAAAWTPRVFPTSVLIDRGGRPRVSVLGGFDWTGAPARALVEPLLGAAGQRGKSVPVSTVPRR